MGMIFTVDERLIFFSSKNIDLLTQVKEIKDKGEEGSVYMCIYIFDGDKYNGASLT